MRPHACPSQSLPCLPDRAAPHCARRVRGAPRVRSHRLCGTAPRNHSARLITVRPDWRPRAAAAEAGEVEGEVEVEDDFVVADDVVEEFSAFSEEVLDFTLAGRHAAACSTREARNADDAGATAKAAAEEEGEEGGGGKAGGGAAPAQRAMGDAKRANYGTGGEKFTSIRLEDVTVTFGNERVLNGVTWAVKTGDRVGLVGQNGCGKTTQLKLMAGTLEPTTGEVVRSSSRTRAAFLRQEFVDELDPARTLREEFLVTFTAEQAALAEYARVETEIGEAADDLDRLDSLLNELEERRRECDSHEF